MTNDTIPAAPSSHRRPIPDGVLGVTRKQVADMFQIDVRSVDRMVTAGLLTRHKVGSSTRFDVDQVMALIGRRP